MSSPALRGVVLAGGNGTRLRPTTLAVNKHLLDVYDEPMIRYPLRTLRESGIVDVVVVTDERSLDDFRAVVGRIDGLNIDYVTQASATGVAGALASVEPAVAGSRLLVILGDTLLQLSVAAASEAYLCSGQPAQVLLCPVPPHRARQYGIAMFSNGKLVDVEEKPNRDGSCLSVVGCYWYDDSVFDRIRSLRPSSRGELEISDINASYAREGRLAHRMLSGWVADAGTPTGKLRASLLVALQKGVHLEL
jgi:glucose-1-phosphate thymidylyltransferase